MDCETDGSDLAQVVQIDAQNAGRLASAHLPTLQKPHIVRGAAGPVLRTKPL